MVIPRWDPPVSFNIEATTKYFIKIGYIFSIISMSFLSVSMWKCLIDPGNKAFAFVFLRVWIFFQFSMILCREAVKIMD